MSKPSRVEPKLLIAILAAIVALPVLIFGFDFFSRIRIRHRVVPIAIQSTPLHDAIMEKATPDKVAAIIDANPGEVNTVDPYLGRPIDIAVGNAEIVELLLKHGASPN